MIHTWDYCGQCECPFVKCGACGNKCCNGTNGEVDGKPCTACDSAYEQQRTETPPNFTEEYMAKKIAEVQSVWDSF